MIPSRGLRWSSQTIGLGRRRIEAYSARQFSSSTIQYGPLRASPLLPRTNSLLSGANTSAQFSRTKLLIRNGAGVRFASTTPTTPTPAPGVTPELPDPTPITTSLDDAFDLSIDSLLNAPEHIGYLKSLGLDYGWGITASMEWVLEHIHVLAGTPWWASIALTAVLVRAVLFRGYISASENSTRIATIQPITKPISEKMTAAMRAGDNDTVLRLRQELMMINKRAGISYAKMMIPFLQAIAGFGTFRILNAMGKLPVPGLETGGALWFHNLAVPDPLLLLPLGTATMLHMVLRKGGETGVQTMNPKVFNFLKWGLPALTVLFTSWLPAATQLSFFVGGALSFGQASLLRQTWFRSFFNMTPLPTPKKPSPYKGALKVAPNPVLTQSELSSRFQGPARGDFPAPEAKTPGIATKIVGGAIKDIKDTVQSVKQSAEDVVGKSKKEVGSRLAKHELKERQKYEKQRAEELRRERWELENDKRLERAQKKLEKLEKQER